MGEVLEGSRVRTVKALEKSVQAFAIGHSN